MKSTYPATVRRQNDLLRRELGSEHGHARYQWMWSEDLQMPMVILDRDGRPELDFFCACGKNVTIHSATCQFTYPRKHWEMRKLLPDHHNQWVLCRWVPPEASREDWESEFGTTPYPEGGYMIPVGDNAKCLTLLPGCVPLLGTTEWIIAGIKDHFSKSAKQRDRETKDNWEKRDQKKEEELVLRCKDAFPVHSGWPGEKQDWSVGGIGEPPVLRQGETTSGTNVE